MSLKVNPFFSRTSEIDRSGGRGWDVIYEGVVLDSSTGRDLLPGEVVRTITKTSEWTIANIIRPTRKTVAISHRNGLVLQIDIAENQSFAEDYWNGLIGMKMVSQDIMTWSRPFVRDVVYQSNGGYQVKYTTLDVLRVLSGNPEQSFVQFPAPDRIGAEKLDQIREARDRGLHKLTSENLFHEMQKSKLTIHVESFQGWVKVDFVGQMKIFWFPESVFLNL